MIRSCLQARRRAGLRSAVAAAVFALSALLASGCSDSSGPGGSGEVRYAQDVQPVFDASCNTMGCHDSATRSEGLSLAGYDDLAEGSDFGAVILPYYPERSHLWLHVTGAVEPRMPLDRDPLPPATIDLLARWIEQGAPDAAGAPMYSAVTRKAFVACQGENTVAVVDMDTGLAVRQIEVDAPHSVYVDVPTRRLFVTRFETASDNVHVYDADTHALMKTGRAGTFPALIAVVRPVGASPQLWVTNFDANPNNPNPDQAVRVLDPETLTQIASFTPANAEVPHGLAVTEDQSKVYVTNIGTDNVTVYSTNPPAVLQTPVALPAAGLAQQPQQCVLSKNEDYLFVSALGSDRVYVMDTGDYSFPATIDVGDGPWHLTLAPGGDELWVANWLGSSVSVVDVSDPTAPGVPVTLTPQRMIEGMPHPVLQRPIGIAFTPDGNRVYVTSANDDESGSGHHPSPEGEKNPGNVAVFDADTREVLSVAEVPNFARFVSFLP